MEWSDRSGVKSGLGGQDGGYRADVLKGVKARQWTINEAWELIESSASEMGLHPDVHVLYPEQHSDSDKHFLTQRDFKGGGVPRPGAPLRFPELVGGRRSCVHWVEFRGW